MGKEVVMTTMIREKLVSVPELVRETGLILEVKREYGRILSQTNFSTPNVHIYFSLSTLVNGAPLSVITDSLADVFQAGAMVCFFCCFPNLHITLIIFFHMNFVFKIVVLFKKCMK